MDRHLEVTRMFNEMIEQGYIKPRPLTESTEDLRFPGELPYIPTIATYGTVDVPTVGKVGEHAELGYGS
ncbi:hypothetical protein [Shinella pollutisoli]|uniref:Uncharacterized protein n=1 Tax=Shinella pollutisoli TaxID=2250594 RepID=A0ABV7DIY9_9HYPH|nr:hypothetical protein [Shinella pollutisoli]